MSISSVSTASASPNTGCVMVLMIAGMAATRKSPLIAVSIELSFYAELLPFASEEKKVLNCCKY